MINTILVEVILAPIRIRLAVKKLLVKRMERIAILYQRSQGTDAKVTMPQIHSNALESLQSSINRDQALIAQRKGQSPPLAEYSESVVPEPEKAKPESVSVKPPERDKRKSRRKSYMK